MTAKRRPKVSDRERMIAELQKPAKQRRPKVRYVVGEERDGSFQVFSAAGKLHQTVTWDKTFAKRIAAALNWHEAHKRGEL